MTEKCCGNCRFLKYVPQDGEWVCINSESYYFGAEKFADEGCPEFDGKDDTKIQRR